MKKPQELTNYLSRPDRQVIRAALADLKTEISRIYPSEPPRILVYGSFARREETNDSDIDVLLVYPRLIQPGKEIRLVSSVLAELNIRYQVLISILPISASIYQSAEGYFWENLRHEVIQPDEI